MPEFSISKSDNSIDPKDFWTVFAIMLRPTKPGEAAEIVAAGEIQHEHEPSDIRPPVYDVVNRGLQRLLKKGKPAERGLLAGEVLIVLKALSDHHGKLAKIGREPSLSKSFAVVAARRGVGFETVQNAWREYRSVSHMWASLRSLLELEPEPNFDEAFTLELLLGADAFLSFASAEVTGRGHQAKPILAKSDACQIVGWAAAGKRAVIPTSPLSKTDLRAFKSYRARKRYG